MADLPAQLGRYRISKLLATGGMGEVFLARQEGPAGFARPAVLKRVLAHLAREPEFIQMFLDEARLAAILAHPNIVQIYELAEDAGTWFIAMEYLDGRSLRAVRDKVSRQGLAMDPVQAARMMSQALDGLAYAHALTAEDGKPLNIVHRDVSPDNIFVGFNGVVKVLDFGIAKAANAIASTKTGMVKGKAAFMPPEQLLAHALDGRTDVYAAGVVLYQLLCGQRPFDAPSDAALIHQILTAPPAPLQPRAPTAPPALCAMVMKAIAKSPANRFQSAAEFSSALERFVAASGVPNTNAQTGAWMKQLFDAATPGPVPVAQAADPIVHPPSAPIRLEMALTAPGELAEEPPTHPDSTLQPVWDAGAPTLEARRPAPLGASAAPTLQARRPSSMGAAESERPPSAGSSAAPTLEADRPLRLEPLAGSLELERPLTGTPPSPEPAAEVLELARPVHPEPVATPDAAPPRASRRGLVRAVAVGAVLAAVAVGYTRWRATLKVTVPDVVVTTDPAGAALRIGGDAIGPTPWAGSNAWTGEVPWEVSAPGYQKKKGTFKGGTAVHLEVKLQRK